MRPAKKRALWALGILVVATLAGLAVLAATLV